MKVTVCHGGDYMPSYIVIDDEKKIFRILHFSITCSVLDGKNGTVEILVIYDEETESGELKKEQFHADGVTLEYVFLDDNKRYEPKTKSIYNLF